MHAPPDTNLSSLEKRSKRTDSEVDEDYKNEYRYITEDQCTRYEGIHLDFKCFEWETVAAQPLGQTSLQTSVIQQLECVIWATALQVRADSDSDSITILIRF